MVEFHVLRCADCQTFQVLQVTKISKWKCKMCGQKQSITKVYGQGSGADCRKHVQKLNSLRCQTDWMKKTQSLSSASEIVASSGFSSREKDITRNERVSHWSCYLDEPKDETDEVDDSWPVYDENKLEAEVASDWTKDSMTCKRKAGAGTGYLEFPRKKSKFFNKPTRSESNICEVSEIRSDCESYNGRQSTCILSGIQNSVEDRNLFGRSEFNVLTDSSLSPTQMVGDKKDLMFHGSKILRNEGKVLFKSLAASSASSGMLCPKGQMINGGTSCCTTADTNRLRVSDGVMREENGRLGTDNGRLRTDNGRLRTDSERVIADNGRLRTDNGRLRTDNGRLRTDNERVIADSERVSVDNGTFRTDNGRVRTDNIKSAQDKTKPKHLPTTGVSKWGAFLDNDGGVVDDDDDDDSNDGTWFESSGMFVA